MPICKFNFGQWLDLRCSLSLIGTQICSFRKFVSTHKTLGGRKVLKLACLLFLDQVLKDSKTDILTMVENYTSGKNPKVVFAKCWFNCKKNYFHRFICYLLLIAVALFESNWKGFQNYYVAFWIKHFCLCGFGQFQNKRK